MRIHRFDRTLLVAAVVSLGLACAESDPIDINVIGQRPGTSGPPSGASGIGSPSGTAGTGNSIGTTGVAGATGAGGKKGSGATGSGGTTGSPGSGSLGGTTGSAGTNGAAGVTGRAGTTGTAGTTGSGGTTERGGASGTSGPGGRTGADGGVMDGGPGGGPVPTFTQVYALLMKDCAGSSCHNPGKKNNIDFSSKAKAYSSLQAVVSPRNSAGSRFYQLVSDGVMPPNGPQLSMPNLALIKGWIDGGALNN